MNNSSQKTTWLKKASLLLGVIFCCAITTSCSNRKQPAPVSELYQGKTFRDFKQQGYSQKTYQVRAGDTLYSIAWYSGNDYKYLAKINKILPPYQIQTGRILNLEKPPKSIPLKSHKATGQTSEVIVNQAVDPSRKQAYGKSEQNVNKDPIGFYYRSIS